jgi:UDP-2-acetamido-3-amino-2,3-dideoxy-glucuronate N-acetyltransferase
VSWLHPLKEQKLVLVGDEAMAVFDDRAPWPEKLALFEGSVSWIDGTPVANPAEPTFVDVEQSEPLANEMQHFIDCVRTRAEPVTNGQEGLRVLEVLDLATNLLLNGRRSTDRVSLEQPAARSSIEGVHETAIVDDNVLIGRGSKIWHFSHILSGSSIGEECSLGQNVVVGPNVTVGDGCKIQNNVSVYEGVTLEEDVFCGPSMVFTNVTTPRAFVNRKAEFAPTLVKRGASIGANATILCGTTVGAYSLIGAGAVVTDDVPDHALMLGVPARRKGWVSREGEVLSDDLVCSRTGESYELHDGELRLVERKQNS